MFYRLRNRTIDNSHFVETDANWLKTYGNVKRSESIIAGTIRSTFPNVEWENRVGEKICYRKQPRENRPRPRDQRTPVSPCSFFQSGGLKSWPGRKSGTVSFRERTLAAFE